MVLPDWFFENMRKTDTPMRKVDLLKLGTTVHKHPFMYWVNPGH